MGQMAVCCQNLPLGALSSRSAPSVLVGELFKKFGLFLNTPCIGMLQSITFAISIPDSHCYDHKVIMFTAAPR
jgi:hypothetical protein